MRLDKTIWAVIASIVLTVGVTNAQVKQKISEEQLTELLSRIDTSTGAFAKSADKAMDKAGYNGSARENDLNDVLKRFTSATSALRNDHSGPNAKGDFEKVLHYGVSIENFLKKFPDHKLAAQAHLRIAQSYVNSGQHADAGGSAAGIFIHVGIGA